VLLLQPKNLSSKTAGKKECKAKTPKRATQEKTNPKVLVKSP
jgi:hypothetical protein